MLDALRRHYPEYLMEAALLGLFMVSACGFGTLLFHPDSPVVRAVPGETGRRVLMGLAMGATAVILIYSPWGKQSGGHINPAVTLAFFRMGKIAGWDAAWYAAFQFTGAVAGVVFSAALLGARIAHPAVHYVVTRPGAGPGLAFAGEFVISFGLMATLFLVMNRERLANLAGLFAGGLIALYISIEQPISGMSMNPARTFGSDLPAGFWEGWWIYFVAPPLGMLLATELHRRLANRTSACAKLHHANDKRCIFCGKPS
jgi:aquaporin Z